MVKQCVRFGGLLALSGLLMGCQSKPAASTSALASSDASQITGASAAMSQGAGVQSLVAQRPISPIQPRHDSQGFVVNTLRAPASQTYYFAFNRSEMRPVDLNALNIQAKYLSSHPNARIRLEGNTDNRGSREYNIALGWRRDQSVARLLEQQGVRPQQIQMVSFGKEKPAVRGENERAWSLNRRVNLVYKVTG